jgi:hypothetical protein
MRVPPEFGSPVASLTHGQAYLAQTSIGQDLADDDRVKVACTPSDTVNASIRKLMAK